MKNNLICYIENSVQKWNMVKDGPDTNTFLLNLLQNKDVNNHTIFIIPTGVFCEGIWLSRNTHKSSRVDFWNFFDDIGTVYTTPETNNDNKKIITEIEEKTSDNTKYGWISPDGKYFHCNYQGHSSLAHDICFGLIDTNNPEHYLEEHGWCKIYKSLSDLKYSIYIGGNNVLTDKQMKALEKLGLENFNKKCLSKMMVK